MCACVCAKPWVLVGHTLFLLIRKNRADELQLKTCANINFKTQREDIRGGGVSKCNRSKSQPLIMHAAHAFAIRSRYTAVARLSPVRTGRRSQSNSQTTERLPGANRGSAIWSYWSVSKRGAWPPVLTTAEALGPHHHRKHTASPGICSV